MKEVADGIYWLQAPVRGVSNVFSSYLIREPEGVLIEPGPSTAIPTIREAMKRLDMNDLAYIMPTHIHVDHAGGAGSLAHLFPHAKVLVHPRGAKHVIDPANLIRSTREVWGENYEDYFGPVLPVPEAQLRVPEDGDVVHVNGRRIQVIYAPGHAPHNMAFYEDESRALFCGEALGLPGQGAEPFPLPAVAPPSFDQELYLETMDKLRRLKPRILFFSHGGVGSDPDRTISVAMENTRMLGDMILKALKEGQPIEAISSMLAEEAASRFGVHLSEMDLSMTVGGYKLYFQKKGLA